MKDGNEKRIEGKEGRRCFVQHRAGRAESLTATKERTIRTIKSGIRAKAFCSSQIWLVKSRLHPGAVGCLVSSVSQAWPGEGLGLLQMAQLNKLLYLGTYFTVWRALSTNTVGTSTKCRRRHPVSPRCLVRSVFIITLQSSLAATGSKDGPWNMRVVSS